MSESGGKPLKIDFAPVMQECQKYAKLMKDIVDKGKMSESDYTNMEGYRLSISDAFCFLIFGDAFDKIRKQYMDLITKQYKNAVALANELVNEEE